ncbi:hypothetical protein D3C79_221900 [compost metagenome]
MIIYLDQNKWIELARMYHGKDNSIRANKILSEFNAVITSGSAVFPLSSIHYMETARISNNERRSRLGAAMWHFSQGKTLASSNKILAHELENALRNYIPKIKESNLKIIGFGSEHAFGVSDKECDELNFYTRNVERAILVGSKQLGIEPAQFFRTIHGENFKNHLQNLRGKFDDAQGVEKDNLLYAILTVDILSVFNAVFEKYSIAVSDYPFDASSMKSIIDSMPTRSLDLHLHRQVLANPNYAAKITDLEDWAGLGLAACYCDVVVCEKHMADMMKRNKYKTKARVETNLENVFRSFD